MRGRVEKRGELGEKVGRAGWTKRMEKSSLEGKSRVERKDGGGWLGGRSRVERREGEQGAKEGWRTGWKGRMESRLERKNEGGWLGGRKNESKD